MELAVMARCDRSESCPSTLRAKRSSHEEAMMGCGREPGRVRPFAPPFAKRQHVGSRALPRDAAQVATPSQGIKRRARTWEGCDASDDAKSESPPRSRPRIERTNDLVDATSPCRDNGSDSESSDGSYISWDPRIECPERCPPSPCPHCAKLALKYGHLPRRDTLRTLLVDTYWKRTPEVSRSKKEHMKRIEADGKTSLEDYVLATTLKTGYHALEKNRFPYDTPPHIEHWTLWALHDMSHAQIENYVYDWIRRERPAAVAWELDENPRRSIHIFHVHIYVAFPPRSAKPPSDGEKTEERAPPRQTPTPPLVCTSTESDSGSDDEPVDRMPRARCAESPSRVKQRTRPCLSQGRMANTGGTGEL